FLIAGQKYYVEALQKEGGGGDNLAVGWAKPGQSTVAPSEVISGEVLTPWTGGNIASLEKTSITSVGAPSKRNALRNVRSAVTRNRNQAQTLRTSQTSSQTQNLATVYAPQVKADAGTRRPLASTMPNGVSVPSDFPFISITTSSNPDPDYIFLDNRGGNGK